MGPRLRGDDSRKSLPACVAGRHCAFVTTQRLRRRSHPRSRCSAPARWPGSSTIIKAHGLDKKANLEIETIELASTEAGKIAIKGGSADMMLSDWLWVARERSLGDNLVFYPSSSTLGAVMVPANSTISSVADLKGKKLAIAGGPLDKSWLLLQGAGAPLRPRSAPPGHHRLWRAAAAVAESRCRASTTRR